MAIIVNASKKPRKRISIRNFVTSSDLEVIKAFREDLQRNHEQNTAFFAAVLAKSTKPPTKPTITESYILRVYREVRIFGNWVPIGKFAGKLVIMYRDNYKFR